MKYCQSGIVSSESGANIIDNSSILLLSPCHDLTRKWNFPPGNLQLFVIRTLVDLSQASA